VEFTDVVRQRRMVRRYRSEPVERALIDRLLTLAVRAPSAGFSQGWHFLVLDDEAAVGAYWSATLDPERQQAPPDRWLRGLQSAPVLIVVFAERAAYERRYAAADKSGGAPVDLERRWPVPYWVIDAGTAAGYLLLAATDAGLGACWFGVPTDRVAALADAFAVPPGFVPVGTVSLGFAAEPESSSPEPDKSGNPSRPVRRPQAEVVSYGRFSSVPAAGD
jgi:nitroreductase